MTKHYNEDDMHIWQDEIETLIDPDIEHTKRVVKMLEDSPYKFKLTGSRYFEKKCRNPETIATTEFTDYDFYAPNQERIHKWLLETGEFECITSDAAMYAMDDDVCAIFSGIRSNVQVILRFEAEMYHGVLISIDPEFYRDYLWKSGPNQPKREQIQAIFNQLYKTYREGQRA